MMLAWSIWVLPINELEHFLQYVEQATSAPKLEIVQLLSGQSPT